MNWKIMLKGNLEHTLNAVEGLIKMVDDSMLDWKPDSGDNWMTTGQLLHHITTCSGSDFKGFITGEWDLPEDFDPDTASAVDMLPPAEKLPTVESLEVAKQQLVASKELALKLLEDVADERLATEATKVPWDKIEMPLGARLLSMVDHLASHKSQLFYYLKLSGKPVHTGSLWGM